MDRWRGLPARTQKVCLLGCSVGLTILWIFCVILSLVLYGKCDVCEVRIYRHALTVVNKNAEWYPGLAWPARLLTGIMK